jgi:ribonucleoside-diphosphate reductase beta chain
MQRNIFLKRTNFKDFEYPEVVRFKEAIQHSYWLVTEYNFHSDIQDFLVNLTPIEQNAIKNTLLAISQIEVSVKRFWGKLGDKFPKAEFDQVGATFAESEVRHADAYSHLLQVLGLNDDFTKLLEEPVIQGRVDYLSKYLKRSADTSDEGYMLTLTLFSLFIENVSLFSQFAIIKSFSRQRNLLKNVDNVVDATMREETIHALFGAQVIKFIQEEKPEWFDDGFWRTVDRAAKKAYDAEAAIIDWIFQDGEIDFMSKDALKEFIKFRLNESIAMIGGGQVFEIDRDKLQPLQWFNDELMADVSTDFFHKRPTNYSLKTQSVTADDLFED